MPDRTGVPVRTLLNALEVILSFTPEDLDAPDGPARRRTHYALRHASKILRISEGTLGRLAFAKDIRLIIEIDGDVTLDS